MQPFALSDFQPLFEEVKIFLEEDLVISSGLKTSWRKSLTRPPFSDKCFNNILAESIPIPYPGCQTEESAGVKYIECGSSSNPIIEISSGILKLSLLAIYIAEMAKRSFAAKIASGGCFEFRSNLAGLIPSL